MDYFEVTLLIFGVVFLLCKPITVLLHELGHAVPAILLTRQKVTIYIGSLGDPNNSLRVNLGILIIFFSYNPFKWQKGLCSPSAETISVNRQIIYTLTGPLGSITIGALASYFAFSYDLHGALKLFLVIFLFSALWDLLVNVIPIDTPIKLYSGEIVYNDGHSLRRLIRTKRMSKDIQRANELYDKQKFADAAVLYENMLSLVEEETIYRVAIVSYLHARNFTKGKELSDAFALTGKMNSNDLGNQGIAYIELGLYDDAIPIYDAALQLDPNNSFPLHNKGCTLAVLEKFEEALPIFNRAIEIDNHAYSYSWRGLTKIKLGHPEDGLHDINHSIEQTPDYAYNYKFLGIYHLNKGECEEALQQFIKAKELDSTIIKINELIEDTKKQINRFSASIKS